MKLDDYTCVDRSISILFSPLTDNNSYIFLLGREFMAEWMEEETKRWKLKLPDFRGSGSELVSNDTIKKK